MKLVPMKNWLNHAKETSLKDGLNNQISKYMDQIVQQLLLSPSNIADNYFRVLLQCSSYLWFHLTLGIYSHRSELYIILLIVSFLPNIYFQLYLQGCKYWQQICKVTMTVTATYRLISDVRWQAQCLRLISWNKDSCEHSIPSSQVFLGL